MSPTPKPLNLDALRAEAAKPDEMGDAVVGRAWLRRVLYELELGRAAELQLFAMQRAPLIAEQIGPGA